MAFCKKKILKNAKLDGFWVYLEKMEGLKNLLWNVWERETTQLTKDF